jgi:hypothetical protein
MATSTPARHEVSTGAVGVTLFAATLMMMTGAFHVIQGIVALANDTFFVYGKDYVFKFDVTGWGWAHIILGVIVGLAGFALFQGAVWARVVAVIVACISIIASFLWMPYYPIWSLIVVAFDVFVIWAVTAHGRDIVAASEREARR